jgi:hypothetical protein
MPLAGSIERPFELDEEGGVEVEVEVSCGGTSCSRESGVRINRLVVPWVTGQRLPGGPSFE